MTVDNPKLLDLNTAVERRVALKAEGKSVVLTNGAFDLLHPGHVYSLTEAAKHGDALFVAVNSDASVKTLKGEGRPIVGENYRALMLGALAVVDTIILFDQPRLVAEIEALAPEVYVKSGDYALDTLDVSERNALESVGAKIEIAPYLEGFSTTEMIEKMARAKTAHE